MYRELFDHSLDAVYTHDFDGVFLDVNPAGLRLLGCSRSEVVGAALSRFLQNPEDVARTERLIEHVLQVGSLDVSEEFLLRCKDGGVVWVEVMECLVRVGGEPYCIQGIARDISERKRADLALAESEERFRTVFRQAGMGMALVDAECARIIDCNEALAAMLGYTVEELRALTVDAISHPVDHEKDLRFGEEMMAGKRDRFQMDKRYRRKDGSVLWGFLTATLVRRADGSPDYVVGMLEDITARKRMEEEFVRVQRMESIGALAGGIAHDLNNLLAPILMSVGLLKEDVVGEQQKSVVEMIERSAVRGRELVRQILSFARGVDGERKPVEIREVVDEMRLIIEKSFPKDIEIRLEVPPSLPPVLADVTRLNQVLLNLCLNARDAMPSGGVLRITAKAVEVDAHYAAMEGLDEGGAYVVCEVADTGTGMTADVRNRIFEPFFTTKEAGKGTGLGLSTALGIIRGHGGFLHVYSDPGRGSVVKAYLPQATAGAEPGRGQSADGPGRETPRGRGQLILVADDEAAVLELTRRTLEAYGYSVVTAEDGARAVALLALRREEIDLVLTDMMMPVMGGGAVISAIRRIQPAIPVIAASGLNSEDKDPAGEAVADAFLLKPYSAETLLSTVNRLLRRKRSDAKRTNDL
ncbi:MAG: PAS domain S-box protein [Opitutales bacterium]|nr:PAS domain S-box protein [Opitutales bacterium]